MQSHNFVIINKMNIIWGEFSYAFLFCKHNNFLSKNYTTFSLNVTHRTRCCSSLKSKSTFHHVDLVGGGAMRSVFLRITSSPTALSICSQIRSHLFHLLPDLASFFRSRSAHLVWLLMNDCGWKEVVESIPLCLWWWLVYAMPPSLEVVSLVVRCTEWIGYDLVLFLALYCFVVAF